jgi:O-antigen/teichoic acid export membrane protein
MGFIIASTLFYNLYVVMLRADKDFSLLSRALLFNSAAMFVLVSTLTYFFELRGIFFASLIATLLSFLFIRALTSYRLSVAFKPVIAGSLFKVGFPILVAGGVYTVLLSIDKIAIIKMLGPRELGYYSIAVLALTYTNTFPKLFGIVLFPNMQEVLGKTGSKKSVLGYVKSAAFMMAYIFPVLLAAAYFLIPLLVHYVLPKYIPGLDSMKILLMGCFFLSLAPLGEKFAIAVNRQVVIIPMVIFAALLGWGLDYFLIKAGYGINGAALGISIAYLTYFLIIYSYALGHCDAVRSIAASLAKIFVPFLYAVGAAILVDRSMAGFTIIVRSVVGGIIWLIAYLPMLWYVNRKTQVVSKIYISLFKKPAIDEIGLASEKVMVEEGVEI